MRLTSWNLLHGTPIPASADQAGLLKRAIDAQMSDVLGVQEVDYFQERSGNENQVAAIAALMETEHWAFAPSIIGPPDGQWRSPGNDDQKIVTDTNPQNVPGYGIGIISKIPVRSWHRLDLPTAPYGKPMKLAVNERLKWRYVHDRPRCALAAVLENDWLIVNTHLSFVPMVNYFQLSKVKKWTRELPIEDRSKIIVMGDFNLPSIIPVQGFNWNSLGKQLTFPSDAPKVQIDYILSQKVSREDVLQMHTPPTGISDHLPLSVDVSW